MSKYDKKIIFDYVVGNDIDNYNIEELENNWEFMKEVFDFTNDKKIYELCDENIKSNFNLVKYLVNKFKDDSIFVLKVASNYLCKAEDKIDKLEMQLMLDKLFNNDDIYTEKYDNMLEMHTFYFLERFSFDLALEETDDDVKEFMQYGFYWFFEKYKDRELITDFIAKKMIDEIFDFRNNSLEEIIHNIYKDKSQVDKISSTKFIIDYISNHDYALSNYLSVHVDIIKELKKSVDLIFKNFNYYNSRKIEELIDGVILYIENYSKNNNYKDETLLIKCISKDLKNKSIWHDFFDEIVLEMGTEEFDIHNEQLLLEKIGIDEFGLDEGDIYEHKQMKNDLCYIKLLNDVKRMLDNEEMYYGFENIEETKKNGECKILKLIPEKEQ